MVFAAGKGADAGGLYGNGLCGVDRDVNANQLAAHSAGAVADAGDGPVIKRNGDALHERFRVAQAAFSSLNDRTQESLTSIRMIKAFGPEDRQSAQFAADAADTGRKNMRVARIDARFDPTIYIAIGTANLLAIGGGSWMVLQGSMTLGQLTSFVMYLGLMIWPMLALAWMFNIVERGARPTVGFARCLKRRRPSTMVMSWPGRARCA